MIDRSLMERYAKELGIELSGRMLEQLDDYAQFLVEYNEKVNLTAITAPEDIVRKHFADSLSVLRQVKIPEDSSLIDVGTGAGFPSTPLLIARPDLHVTQLDSLQKRIVFLQALAGRLGVPVTAIHARAEEAGRQPAFRERFDFATARAVAHLRELSEYCLPFVRVGGKFLALKGPEMETELRESERAISLLGGEVEDIRSYTLPGSDERRTLVVVTKRIPTPKAYPRPSAKMAKKPLQ
ncbi:16S rRNA (guanine(527)-N(7))-methyltransferase RsmG [Zongyangia hominis]|uniref:Ribosomal RNA small subunit methyltransferase G n=1 Tax=Zongyangia hominis TaxID=2763677 RepID=A0A926EDX5_9FIRM|nr:16S rRNA (guanine(527)-N(7))-methyltransferase RsmG [Zongyangia hominis]MBC8570649.1 16S rRNA (guanine(527)-N(7))-methyltransferase RsmG [Zongyangia hominis]